MGILANNDGKILRANQHGSVLKQNYNFGRSFVSLNNIFLRSVKNVEYLSIAGWFYVNNSRGNFLALNNFVSSESFALSYNPTENDHDIYYYSGSGLKTNFMGLPPNSKRFVYLKSGGIYINNSGAIGASTILPTDSKLELFQSDPYGFNPQNYSVSLLRLYSVELNDNQINYEYNNMLGNDSSQFGNLTSEYTFSLAEIISIEGTDKICIKDEISDNHLEIINLPAGTIQEQLDYANANLFETW